MKSLDTFLSLGAAWIGILEEVKTHGAVTHYIDITHKVGTFLCKGRNQGTENTGR